LPAARIKIPITFIKDIIFLKPMPATEVEKLMRESRIKG